MKENLYSKYIEGNDIILLYILYIVVYHKLLFENKNCQNVKST